MYENNYLLPHHSMTMNHQKQQHDCESSDRSRRKNDSKKKRNHPKLYRRETQTELLAYLPNLTLNTSYVFNSMYMISMK